SSLTSCDACLACEACVVCLAQGGGSVVPCAALSPERLGVLRSALHHPWRCGGAGVRRVLGSGRLLPPPPHDTAPQSRLAVAGGLRRIQQNPPRSSAALRSAVQKSSTKGSPLLPGDGRGRAA